MNDYNAFGGEWLDIGLSHQIQFTVWEPDREFNPQYDHLPDVAKVGLIIRHTCRESDTVCAPPSCFGTVLFDNAVTQEFFADRPKWNVLAEEPLTLEPSLLCHCGDHGFIRNGLWESS